MSPRSCHLHDMAQPRYRNGDHFFGHGAVAQLTGVVPSPRADSSVFEQRIAGAVRSDHLANVLERAGDRGGEGRAPEADAELTAEIDAPPHRGVAARPRRRL